MFHDRRTLIIAEVGVNHNGDLDLAKRLVDAAASAGADLVKFQTFAAESLSTKTVHKANYQMRNSDANESQFEMLCRLELTANMHRLIKAHCEGQGIGFLSSAFDIESIDFLSSLNPEYFKIPSGEITNLPYLRRVASSDKPLLLSTGMATLGEIEEALIALEGSGAPRTQITILHCNTEYPTPMRDVNLRAMLSIRDAFGVSVGVSDHTMGIEVPIAAVALGAKVVEKHLTLDRGLAGPDHKASLEVDEFNKMVLAIRNIELAMGDGIKRPSPSEIKNRTVVRKSLVASRQIAAGEVFSAENITAKRAGVGISPMRWDEVIGRVAGYDFLEDELIVL